MATITVIGPEDRERWDETVRSFPDYDVMYLSAYSAAFMKENPANGIPVLLLYTHGEDRAVSVMFRRDVGLDEKLAGRIETGRYYDLISPYGYGGFRGSVSDWETLGRTYRDWCESSGNVCEFVRFSLFSDYSAHYGGETETRTHVVVRELDLSPEDLWMDFRQKVRKNVRRAEASGLKILVEPTDAHLEDFLRIYYGTMERDHSRKDFYFSREFFETLSGMRDNVMYFHAVHEGQIVSTELVLYDAFNCYSYLGGTDSAYFPLRPNDLLKFEVIRWAREKGLKSFVLGGGYGSDDGIFQYKLALAPHGQRDFFIGRQIFDRAAYDRLVACRQGEPLDENYFPLYRG